MAWLFLVGAIGAELFGTLGLRAVAQSPVWWAIALITVAYTISFVCMGFALRQLNVGVVYAIWSAVGTAAVSLLGVALFGERLNWQAALGMVLLVGGVLVLVTSGSVRHG
ncbi:MAG TPA: SMR family transporter [Jatrophihabitantaceae bacterium]|jgi:small multidrug resistance pump|nr:SMR family transporter [Jatrophihabitantaceae bacterium]